MGLVLAVDFGTSNTVAVLRAADGQAESVLFDGSPVLPSGVFLQADGTILTGRDALFSARGMPERFEPNPKLRVDDDVVWLDTEVTAVELFAAVLGRVAAEAGRAAAVGFDRVVLTHPAGWGVHRTAVLGRAAEAAGLTPVTLVAEPVAAARHLAGEDDQPLVIYDLVPAPSTSRWSPATGCWPPMACPTWAGWTSAPPSSITSSRSIGTATRRQRGRKVLGG
jgi:molecular chaperone DnaK (HSP70)